MADSAGAWKLLCPELRAAQPRWMGEQNPSSVRLALVVNRQPQGEAGGRGQLKAVPRGSRRPQVGVHLQAGLKSHLFCDLKFPGILLLTIWRDP